MLATIPMITMMAENRSSKSIPPSADFVPFYRDYFLSTAGAAGWLALAMESRMVVSAMVFCIW